MLTWYFLPLVFGAPLFIFAFICSPTGRLEEYLNCMDKIQKAVEYFQDNSPDSPELNRVVGRRSGSWQGWERDRQTDMCRLPSCCKRLVGLLPGEKGVWAQLRKCSFWLFFLSLSPVVFLLVVLSSCFVQFGLVKAYPARGVESIELPPEYLLSVLQLLEQNVRSVAIPLVN